VRFYIDGYTSSRGPLICNLRLSQRRADWVKDFMISRGVAENRIKIVVGWENCIRFVRNGQMSVGLRTSAYALVTSRNEKNMGGTIRLRKFDSLEISADL
jgi:hypothetical protein